MSLLSEYEGRTAWKYNPITGRFPTHPALTNKVDDEGRFRPFHGSTVVFKLDRWACRYLQYVSGRLQERLCGMLAQPIPEASFHMTLHDLISPEQTDTAQIFVDDTRTAYTSQYLCEVTRSLKQAAKAVEEIRSQYPGRHIQMIEDRVVNMVSKSIVLMLRPTTEEDFAFLLDLYHRFDAVKTLSYPLTPHVTLACFKPGEIDGEQLAEAVKEVQVDENNRTRFELSVEGLVAQRFADMGHYEDVPERICFCCDGGMNRSVMAAAILNHEAERRGIPIRAEARAAFRNTEGHPIPQSVIETLAAHGVPTEAVPGKARYLKREDYVAFSKMIAMTGGARTRGKEIGIHEDEYAMRNELFLNIPDPEYGANPDDVFQMISSKVNQFMESR